MTTMFLAIGLVLIFEGAALAFAPSSLFEELLRLLQSLPQNARYLLGALMITLGLLLVNVTLP